MHITLTFYLLPLFQCLNKSLFWFTLECCTVASNTTHLKSSTTLPPAPAFLVSLSQHHYCSGHKTSFQFLKPTFVWQKCEPHVTLDFLVATWKKKKKKVKLMYFSSIWPKLKCKLTLKNWAILLFLVLNLWNSVCILHLQHMFIWAPL